MPPPANRSSQSGTDRATARPGDRRQLLHRLPNGRGEPDAFSVAVLDLVDAIPKGRVLAYGDVAAMLGRGGPRQVAQVMARWGNEVPWWRVLRANGTCAPDVADRQLTKLRREKVAMRGDRIDMTRARWPGTD